jgi:nuclear pore complex protein Nup98-Nup96
LFLDYLEILDCPTLLESVVRAGANPNPDEAARLKRLATSVPRILQLLPSVFPEKEGNVQTVAGVGDVLSAMYRIAGLLCDAGYVGVLLLLGGD